MKDCFYINKLKNIFLKNLNNLYYIYNDRLL